MRIYTIGYGNRKFEDSIELLRRFKIKLVVDIRSFPRSKWPEFEEENLQDSLPSRGIGYVHLRELGGYRRGGYGAHMKTDEFREGLRKLMELASKNRAVIMCLESYPSGCHRRFIADRLKEVGWEVIHIVGKKGRQRTL
jgi:uncharacterized protein (DUF488 family)